MTEGMKEKRGEKGGRKRKKREKERGGRSKSEGPWRRRKRRYSNFVSSAERRALSPSLITSPCSFWSNGAFWLAGSQQTLNTSTMIKKHSPSPSSPSLQSSYATLPSSAHSPRVTPKKPLFWFSASFFPSFHSLLSLFLHFSLFHNFTPFTLGFLCCLRL